MALQSQTSYTLARSRSFLQSLRLPRARTFVRVCQATPSAMAQNFDYDIFVIGGGSGGVRASRMASQKGAKVGLCELPFDPVSSESKGGLGGTAFAADFEDARGFGWSSTSHPTFKWESLLQAKTQEITRLNGIYSKLLDGAGVQLYTGAGRLLDAHTVQITTPEGTTERVTSKTILVATGGSAVKPEIPGAEFGVTSDEALTFDQLPKRILIIGGGYIALEFAGIFQGFGSEVSLMYRQPLPLRGFDSDLRETVNLNLKQRNINVHENCVPERITRNDDGSLQVQSSSGALVVDAVMFATGRQPNTTRPDLGLEQVGVDLDENRAIIVNEFSQTSIPSIWAIGDVTNRVNLTPVALMEGMAFVSSVVEGTLTRPDYKDIPCAVFSQPPVATVGLSEEQAIAQGYTCDIFCSTFTPMRSTLAGRKEKSLMKLVVDTESERVLGVHMVGIDAPEILQGFATALKCGATKSQFDATVGIHPSSAEEFVTMRTRSRQVGPKTQ